MCKYVSEMCPHVVANSCDPNKITESLHPCDHLHGTICSDANTMSKVGFNSLFRFHPEYTMLKTCDPCKQRGCDTRVDGKMFVGHPGYVIDAMIKNMSRPSYRDVCTGIDMDKYLIIGPKK